jgi:FdrA protein
MFVKGFIKKSEYFDSVSLMIVSREISEMEGILDSAVVMGTKENKSILEAAGLLISEFENTNDTDLLIGIKAESERIVGAALKRVEELFLEMRDKSDDFSEFQPKSLEGALKQLPDANLSLISVAGKYAAREAKKALENGLNVMLFSDNVSIKDELKLKKYALTKGLFVMGPDCGTAIINGVPLAFANVLNRGNIGITAASGTGLQEVSSIISNEGAGISQAIGTGGRDVKKEIGGLMFIAGMKALNNDPQTEVIVLISKPPDDEVLEKISEEIKKIQKPIVAIFIGGESEVIKKTGAIRAETLEQTALFAVAISKGQKIEDSMIKINERDKEINKFAVKEISSKTENQKYLRGLFSGGTLCDETQLILKDRLGDVFSNTPLNPEYKLQDSWKSDKNTILDLGDDEFTVGRPHPMIDFSLRNKKILEEASDSEVAVILFDVVLGYGSNMKPAEELVPILIKAKQISPNVSLICSVIGTDKDPQNRELVKSELENSGAIIMSSNAAASELAGKIIKSVGGI